MTDAQSSELSGPTSTGVDPRLSALLCYTAWFLSGLVFLVIEQQHRAVRFHAAQSVVLFGGFSALILLLTTTSVGMLVVSPGAFQAVRVLLYLVWLAAVLMWLVVMLKTIRGETWKVPMVRAELAERLAAR